ncbi:MAG: flagellar motor protein MotB [Lachnospiraceae bacterium]
MARKKQQKGGSGGAPAWMATFSDLMNLLLCFFVLLFSMSTVEAEKFELVIASLQSSFSVLPAGGSSVGEGQLISAGVSQLDNLSIYFENTELGAGESEQTDKTVEEQYEQAALEASEQMAEQINQQVAEYGVQSQVEVDFNSQYVLLTLNGALLFDSGKAEIKNEAIPLIDKIGAILTSYDSNIIEIEGHTDNVPISNAQYANNDVLSMFRALSVADYIRGSTDIDPSKIKSSGRGEYDPIADNSTPEGRAKNRRVEIKIYNAYSSDQ